MTPEERFAAIGPAFIKAMTEAARTVIGRGDGGTVPTPPPGSQAIILSEGVAVLPAATLAKYGDDIKRMQPGTHLIAAEDALAELDDDDR